MATIVLGAVAGALAQGSTPLIVGLAVGVGSAVGAYVDSQLIMPALFGRPESDDIIGDRLKDYSVQAADEGEVIKYVSGVANRIAGTIIWLSDLKETRHTQSVESGGKGGGSVSSSSTTYTYAIDSAIAICKGKISELKKIWADSKLMYDIDRATLGIANLVITTAVDRYPVRTGDIPDDYTVYECSVDLSRFKKGQTITVSGCSNSGNNGTFGINKIYYSDSISKWILKVHTTSQVDETVAGVAEFFQRTAAALILDMTDVTVYDGTETQTPDTLLESYLGSGNVPAFRGVAYLVIESLQLANYGNRLPLFTFEVEKNVSISVAEVIDGLCEHGGLEAAEYDTSSITGTPTFYGYYIDKLQSPAKFIEPMLLAYDIAAQERSGVLHFFNRGDPDEISISEGDLATRDFGSEAPVPFKVPTVQPRNLPRDVLVEYYDRIFNYQRGTQIAQRINAIGFNVQKVVLPLVLLPGQALEVGKRFLWAQHSGWRRAELSLPPRYLTALAGDILNVVYSGETYSVRVLQIDRGNNFELRVRGLIEDVETAIQDDTADELESYTQSILTAPGIKAYVLNLPALRFWDADDAKPGFYYALARETLDSDWRGAYLMQSANPNSGFVFVANRTAEAIVGLTTTELGDVSSIATWDRVNSARIQIRAGELESVTEEEALLGKNAFLIGDEIIIAKTVTLVSSLTYDLTDLLRGRRDTGDETGNHSVEERVVKLDQGSIGFKVIDYSMVKASRWFLAVGEGGDYTVELAEQVELTGATLRPFAPQHVVQRWTNAVNEREISWIPANRGGDDAFSSANAPRLENEESEFRVEVRNSSDVLKRTFKVKGSQYTSQVGSVIVSLALLSDNKIKYPLSWFLLDFPSALSVAKVIVYQVSSQVGDSKPSTEVSFP